MQQFVLFVLDDVPSLFPTISNWLRRRIQLIWTLGVQELFCCVWGDLRGAFAVQSESCVSQSGWRRQTCRAPRTSLASREGGCGVAGRQDLKRKMDRGDVHI